MSKEKTRRARLEPWTSRFGVRGISLSATHVEGLMEEIKKEEYQKMCTLVVVYECCLNWTANLTITGEL